MRSDGQLCQLCRPSMCLPESTSKHCFFLFVEAFGRDCDKIRMLYTCNTIRLCIGTFMCAQAWAKHSHRLLASIALHVDRELS